MTRFALISVLVLSLVACTPSGPTDRDLTTTQLMPNATIVAQLAETSTAAAEFVLTQSVATAVPTSTATTPPTIGPSIEPPTLTPTAIPTEDNLIPVTLNPSVITDVEAPIRIDVPEGWKFASDALLIPGAEGMSVVPFSLYQGEVTGGKGTVIVLWAFENVVPASPVGGALSQLNLYADGLRLLLFTVIESECQFGYNEEQVFSVGGMDGVGTYFIADECPDDLPSIQGWFSALRVNRLNFAFYAYTEPQEAILGAAREELQAILDSVEFDFSLLPTPEPTSAGVILTVTPSTTPDEATTPEVAATVTSIPSSSTPIPQVQFVTATPVP